MSGFRVVFFYGLLGLFFVVNLHAEEPDDAYERITNEVIEEFGYIQPEEIDSRFQTWLETVAFSGSSGDQIDSGTCGAGISTCDIQVDNEDLQSNT